jgi:hypothetical protein
MNSLGQNGKYTVKFSLSVVGRQLSVCSPGLRCNDGSARWCVNVPVHRIDSVHPGHAALVLLSSWAHKKAEERGF